MCVHRANVVVFYSIIYQLDMYVLTSGDDIEREVQKVIPASYPKLNLHCIFQAAGVKHVGGAGRGELNARAYLF
jgi:hypothetical protein